MITRDHLEITFFKHPSLWLFLPEHLFKEQAKIGILRYNFYMTLPTDYNMVILEGLLLNQKKDNFNKWAHNYVNLINKLNITKFRFHKSLTTNDQRKIWLEFFCFVMRLELKADHFITSEISYDLFSREYLREDLADNIIKYKSKYPFINTLIKSVVRTSESQEHDKDVDSYRTMYVFYKKSIIALENYTIKKKLSLQECVAIIQLMLHITCMSGYTSLISYNNIQKYIKDNLIYKQDRLNSFLFYHENFISLILDENDKIQYDNIFAQKDLVDMYDKFISISSIFDDCIPMKILCFFYIHKKNIFYTDISENVDLTQEQRNIQVLEKEAVFYDNLENEMAQNIFSNNTGVFAIKEYLEKWEFFKYEANPHNIVKLLKYRRRSLLDKNDIMEKNRQRKLSLSVNFFLRKVKKNLSDYGLELSLEKLLKNNITYDTNSLFWQELCIKNRPENFIPKTILLESCSKVTYKEELELCQLYSNILNYQNKFSKEKVYKIYVRTFDIILEKELKLYDSFEEKMYILICFSYNKLYKDRDYFNMKYNNIIQFVYYKIFKLCEEHFSVINKNYLEYSTHTFMGERYLSEMNSVFKNRINKQHKEFLLSILNLKIYQNKLITEMKNDFIHLLTIDKKENQKEYFISLISNKKLIPVVKYFNKWLQETETFYDNNKSVPILFILFYMINAEFGNDIFDHFPLNTRDNILLLLGEVLYYDYNILNQIIGKNQNNDKSSLKYNYLNNKGRCGSLKPVIIDLEKLFYSYHENIKREYKDKIIYATALDIFKIIDKYCDHVCIDLIGFCFLKWLVFDLEDLIYKKTTVLDRMKIIQPPLIKAPEKLIINATHIISYIFNLEQKFGISCGLNNLYYPDTLMNIYDKYTDLNINPYIIISQENVIKDTLYLLENEYNNLSFDKKITCYSTCQLIKVTTVGTYSFSLNYKLLFYIENDTRFQELTGYISTSFSNTMHKMIHETLDSEEKIRSNLLIGHIKNNVSYFDNDITKELLIYIISPEDTNIVIIIGVISTNKEFLNYYKKANITNNGIYFPINRLPPYKPCDKNYRAIFLKGFFITEKVNIENINMASEVFDKLLYTDSENSMTFAQKFLINWNNYVYKTNNFIYYKKDSFSMTLDTLKNYAIKIYKKFLKDLPQVVSYHTQMTFIKEYTDFKNVLHKQCNYIMTGYLEALDKYNDKKIPYNYPKLSIMQEFYFLISYIKNRNMYDQGLSITNFKTKHLEEFKKEFLNNTTQGAYFKFNDILTILKNQYNKYDGNDESLEKIMQYIYRLEQATAKNNDITITENITEFINSNETFIENYPVGNVILNTETPSMNVIPISLEKKKLIKIISWNVNSIVAREELFLEFIKNTDPDIILLQELKCTADNFPKKIVDLLQYNIALNCYKAYNGVAILSKYPFTEVSFTLPGKIITKARYLEVAVNIGVKTLNLASIYVPYGNPIGSKKYKIKLSFLDALRKRFKQLKPHKNFVILGGDYNIDPNKELNKLCCTIQEREKFSALLNLKLLCENGVTKKSNSLQLDHFLISANKVKKISVKRYRQSKKETRQTGHAKISCKVKLKHDVVTKGYRSLYIMNEENSYIIRKNLPK